MKYPQALTVACLLAAPLATTANPLETVHVTASRLPNATYAGRTTLERTDIERINAPSMTALLRKIPNIIVSENGGAGSQSFLSVRGGDPNFTLILIDGVAVNDPTNSRGGGFDFNQIDPSVLERIEVYRGGSSAIHGSESISGVIHLITRSKASSTLAVDAGNDDQRRANLTLSQRLSDTTNALISLSHNEQTRNAFASYRNTQALAKLDHSTDGVDLSLLASLSDQAASQFAEDSGGDRLANPRLAERRDSKQSLLSLRGIWRPADRLLLVGRTSLAEHREDSANPGIEAGAFQGIPASEIQSRYRRLEAEAYAQLALAAEWQLTAGANTRHAEGSNRGFLDFGFPVNTNFTLDQRVNALFVETEGQLAQLGVSAGTRLEAPEDFSRRSASRISLGLPLAENLQLSASYAQGYKLPSFFALAHPLVGNASLRPERSTNRDINLQYEGSSGGRISVSYFSNIYRDLVDFDPELFTSVNRSYVTAEGLEWAVTVPLSSWLMLTADATYLRTDIRDSDESLRRRPRWSGGASLRGSVNRWQWQVSADSRGRFIDSSVPTGVVVASGYTMLDAAFTYQYSDRLSLLLNMENLLNTSFEEAVGFKGIGRQWRAGLRYSL